MAEFLAPGVYIEEIPSAAHPIAGVSTSTTGFIGTSAQGPLLEPTQVTGFGDFERTFGPLQANIELGYAAYQFFLNAGQDAWVVRVNDLNEIPAALTAVGSVDPIGLLCIPGCSDAAVLQAAIAYCDQHRTFLVVDPPSADVQATRDTAAMIRATGTSNAAVYFPPVNVGDPTTAGASRQSFPCGPVAGMIARTDIQRGVSTAPAGISSPLFGVLGPVVDVDYLTAQSLSLAGVNAIRSIPMAGVVVWTARTVSSNDQWKFISVRRLALYIESSLIRGLQWAVFEPNGEPLWAQMCAMVSDFLTELWKQGALSGSTAADAFTVKCGLEVMTQNDIDNGRALMLVGFAPTAPSRMVMLQVTVQMAA